VLAYLAGIAAHGIEALAAQRGVSVGAYLDDTVRSRVFMDVE
jgi:hypothetical protein